jgi:hypothetical protein
METQETKAFDLKEFKRNLSARIDARIKTLQAELAKNNYEEKVRRLAEEGKSEYCD